MIFLSQRSKSKQSPLSLEDCYINGKFDIFVYINYELNDEFFKLRKNFLHDEFIASLYSDDKSSKTQRVHTRSVKKHKTLIRTDDGDLREITYKDTIWYLLYVSNTSMTLRLRDLFRRRFRIPYHSFLELYDEVKENELFSRWTKNDAVGDPPSNLKLLMLGFSRYVGRS